MPTTKFTIRNATFSEMDFFISLARNEGWNPGLEDAFPFYQTDPRGFFIGEINKEKIGCVSAVAYNHNYGFMGFYIVIPKYRGQGMGLRLWNHAVNYLGSRCIGLDGVVAQQENYKKSHFQLHYRNIRFKGELSDKVAANLLPCNLAPVKKLYEYDEKICGFTRNSFLKSWLEMSNSYSLSKFENGELKGFGTIRKCFEGYKIGPLFADNMTIASEILQGLSGKAGNEPVFFDVPESNQDAVRLAESLKF